MKNLKAKIYHGSDPGELPAYQAVEVARYLRVPYHTLQDWLRPVEVIAPKGKYRKPLIQRPQGSTKLSFWNLVEGHVIKALQQQHKVPLSEIRRAVDYAEAECGVSRLLINRQLKVGVKQLFIEKYGSLISLGRGGQLAMQRVLERYLERVEYDNNLPVRFYPFVGDGDRKVISISPTVAFGKPVISLVNTRVIAERFDMGEDAPSIAADYDIKEEEVEEAIIYEAAAA